MGKIDDRTVERIKESAKIEEVVGDFIKLTKRGNEYDGLCPFHGDRHFGNFKVSPTKNIAKCFSCGWSGDSIEFLMKYGNMNYRDSLAWLARKYGIFIDEADRFDYVPPQPKPKPTAPPMTLLTLPMQMVENREHLEEDNLARWMLSRPYWDGAQRKRCEEVLKEYHVGHSKNGHTIFWQIDEKQQVRTGKMMKYNINGKRDREAKWSFDFIHSVLSRTYDEEGHPQYQAPWPYPDIVNPDKQEMTQTLFGMHLLDRYPGAEVYIVESEKTALLMAAAWGNHQIHIWMACGGKENLTREKIAPLIERNRKLRLFPDRDGIEEWQQIAQKLEYDKITVDTRPVEEWWKPCDGDKADIADVVLRLLDEEYGNQQQQQ